MHIPEIKYSNILFATEFSEQWKEVFIQAINISKQYDAKLTLLHVLNTELIDLLIFDVGLERSSAINKKFTLAKDYIENARKIILDRITEAFGEEIVNQCNIIVERGNPVKTILAVAEEIKCDLIVMGFKGRGVSEDYTLGSTVNKVLHKSKLPVMVVHNI